MIPESWYWALLAVFAVALLIALSRRKTMPPYAPYQILAIGCTPMANLLDRHHHRLAGIVVFMVGGLLLLYVTILLFVNWRKRKEIHNAR
jgi:hypothetical protein